MAKSNTAEYRAWHAMHQRCRRHPDYKGRDIEVCNRWAKYENFLADMGRKPSPAHSLDRIDNDGDYAPNNCRWATRQEQRNNQRPFIPEKPDKATCFAIRKARELLHESQKEFGRRLGVDQATISRWETGDLVIQGAAKILLRRLLEEM